MQANVTRKESEHEEDSLCLFYSRNWHETWTAFNLALRSTDDFHAFDWTIKLLKSGIPFAYFKFGLYKLKLHVYWRSWVPALAIALIVIVVVSYFVSLRIIIRDRWCCPTVEPKVEIIKSCPWLLLHDAIVLYLSLMIIFNFLSACFRSPGVVLGKERQTKDDEILESTVAVKASHVRKAPMEWSSKDSRGGFCGIDPILNVAREDFLVKNYYNIATFSNRPRKCDSGTNSKRKQNQVFPSNQNTFCTKCRVKRPPRCHHCSICDRCVLQFDHHCVWLNNCVGYNNYRAFLLTLLYLNLGCWYGILMLCRPFWEELNTSSDNDGWEFLHGSEKAIVGMPTLVTVFSSIANGTVEKELIIKLVFPFLLAIGLLQAFFFGYHLVYVLSALTTLEYKILLDLKFDQLVENSSSYVAPPNPFNQGSLQNMKNAFGPVSLMFLPIQVDPKEIKPTLNAKILKEN